MEFPAILAQNGLNQEMEAFVHAARNPGFVTALGTLEYVRPAHAQ